MNGDLLVATGLSAGYGRVDVLHGIALAMGPGQLISVIGPNGAGKTTLLGALMGTVRSHGTVRLAGSDLTNLATGQRVSLGMSLVSERRELFAAMTVEDNLRLGGYARRRAGARDLKTTLDEVFGRFPRLRERRFQRAGTLSGGERQMLAIGRALMNRPRLLMLDEPSLGLAPLVIREILATIVELRDGGMSILIVEQNARAALQMSDYAYVLEAGAIAFEGASAELAGDARVAESYLGLKRFSSP